MNSRYSDGKRAAAVRGALHQFLDLLAEGVARKLIEEQCQSGCPTTRISSDTGLESDQKPSSVDEFKND